LQTANQRFVAQVYLDLLQREVEPGGLTFWAGLMDQGMPASQVVSGIAGSTEYRTLQVQDMYTELLHRNADSTELNTFVDAMATGVTPEQVAVAISGSAEYFQTRGAGTNEGFLSGLYEDQLNRAIDATGQAGFTSALANGGSRDQVAMAVM